jgi:UDP-2,3-diacylglucosamine pyrophosphatase LpxH
MREEGHDLIVISDLHLGRGRDPRTGRYHILEAFFSDEDFAAFCAHLCTRAAREDRPFKLILDGDALDLLRVEPGAVVEPAWLAREILAGHPGFVAGLARVLREGHEVVFLPGNHDLSMQSKAVQAEIRAAVGGGRLRFEPWFFHEPGRVWIEHGSQYDREGAFRYPLRGPLAVEDERDLPLGNFVQRYLYNGLGPITFLVPPSGENPRYVRWLVWTRPRDLARLVVRHLPFVRQLLRRLARGPSPVLAATHDEVLRDLAGRSGLGARLLEIDALKRIGDTGRDLSHLAWGFVRTALGAFLLLLVPAGLWSSGNVAIAALDAGLFLKSALSVALSFTLLLTAGAVLLYWLFQRPARVSDALPVAAGEISRLASVPLVVFGHTHKEAIMPLAGGRYVNLGTWIAVFHGSDPSPRERVQLTYLEVRGDQAELLYFCRWGHRPRPVIIVDGA